jgi:hypothetical protein
MNIMNAHLPKNPFDTLALSLSGGGYRAASFHLGLMTYLSSLQWKDTTLLEKVRVISTVSGGTFTGVCYASALANGQTLDDCYKKLYRFMSEVDLIEEGLQSLSDFAHWNSPKTRSLINAFSKVYFDKLEPDTFASLFTNEIHLKELIFNATEFSYGLPFRFQRCQQSPEEYKYAYLGNRQVNMPFEAIKEVRLSDIIAASSCFPMGFEPINFPDDFRHENSPILDTLKESDQTDQWGNKCDFPIGLMDGGIVDNQGIDSVLWAEKRMKEYKVDLKKFISEDETVIDLYIISDVASPFMDSYLRTKEKPFNLIRKLSFKSFLWYGIISILLGAGAVAMAIFTDPRWLDFLGGALAALFLLFGGVSIFLSRIFSWALKKFEVPAFFAKKIKHFTGLKFGIYETLISNRIKSVISMVSEVFMKQVRRQEYGRAYNDPKWKNRLIMNGIYELTSQHTLYRNREKKDVLSKDLKDVSTALMKAAEKAKSMGTTLWFTPDELQGEKENMLNSLIACGQFTACFNLLEYIEKVLWNKYNKPEYDNYPEQLKMEIKELFNQMLSDWKTFNKDPYWMIKSFSVK